MIPAACTHCGRGSPNSVRKVPGRFNDHAVPGNCASLTEFLTEVERLSVRILRRRSQRGHRRWNWSRFHRLARR